MQKFRFYSSAIFLASILLCAVSGRAQYTKLDSIANRVQIEKLDTIKNLAILCSDTATNFVFWMKGYAIPNKSVTVYKNASSYQLNQALDYGSEYFTFYDKNGETIKYIVYKAKVVSK